MASSTKDTPAVLGPLAEGVSERIAAANQVEDFEHQHCLKYHGLVKGGSPLQWALGRIVALHPGQDGIVRVVTVKTKSGEFKRPVKKLSFAW